MRSRKQFGQRACESIHALFDAAAPQFAQIVDNRKLYHVAARARQILPDLCSMAL
jgi:hypothetical protein